MTADVFTIRSRNPHADCRAPGGFPCRTCRDRQREEQAARDRHPAGSDLPVPLDYEVKDDGNGRFVRVHVTSGHVDLDESMLAELHSAVVADLCTRDGCPRWATGMDGLCSDHRDMAEAVQINGWRR